MKSHAIWDHTVLPATGQLVLDLATSEGCKAELIWEVIISQYTLPSKCGHLFEKHWTVSWLEIVPATESRKSNVLTSTIMVVIRQIFCTFIVSHVLIVQLKPYNDCSMIMCECM